MDKYGKNKRFSDGLNTKCKSCVNENFHASKLRKLIGKEVSPRRDSGKILEAANSAIAAYEQLKDEGGFVGMRSEQEGNTILRNAIKDSFELRFWQDGTLSDVGVRPIGETADLWVPLQLKYSGATPPMFCHISARYECAILCLTAEGTGAYVLSQEIISEHASKLPPSGKLKIRPAGTQMKSPTSHIWRETWLGWNAISKFLTDQWAHSTNRFTERELRMQVNASSYTEFLHIDLARRFDPGALWEWPVTTMGVTDQYRNGEAVQFKSACQDDTGFEASNMSKKIMQTKVPFEVGDNNW